uniref:Retrotransposon gag domain-containing protein n=1 Tax=Oryzias latipes TaxID=8090 RepID=A0A3P9KXT9_ORYLA
ISFLSKSISSKCGIASLPLLALDDVINRLRHAISVQGTLLSRQADALTQLSAAQQDLFRRLDSITHTLAELTKQPSNPTVSAQAAASGNNPTSADAMTPENFRLQPEPFSGDVAACGGFLLQCQLIFQQAPRFYQSDHSRISLIVNALRNKALQWAQAFLASNPISHLPFDRFIREFRLVFDQPRKQEEATRRLLSLKQGNRSVSEHLIDFRILAVEAGWPDPLRNLPLNPPSSPSRTKSNKPKVRYLIMLPVLLELYTYPTL